MKRRTKTLFGIVVAATVALFFFAPVFYSEEFLVGFPGYNEGYVKVYRSLGCVFFGLGDTYHHYDSIYHYTLGPVLNSWAQDSVHLSCEISNPSPPHQPT